MNSFLLSSFFWRNKYRALDLRTGTSTSTRFNWKFLRVLSKKDTSESFILLFSPKKLVRLFILKEVKPSPDSRMIKLLTLITFSRHYDILAKTRGRMTMAITSWRFSRQIDAGSRVSNTQYWENLVLVVVLVSESKALYCGNKDLYHVLTNTMMTIKVVTWYTNANSPEAMWMGWTSFAVILYRKHHSRYYHLTLP